MLNILVKYNLEEMISVVQDRLEDYKEHCDEEEYGLKYGPSLTDTIKLLNELKQIKGSSED